MKVTTTLHNATQGHKALSEVWQHAKPILLSGQKLTLTVAEEKRNLDQNALLHALLGEVSAKLEWGGRKWDIEDWKRLLTAAWLRARKESAIVVPALDGHGFDVLYRRTSQLTKAECAELIDFIQAWAVERGVEFTNVNEPHHEASATAAPRSV